MKKTLFILGFLFFLCVEGGSYVKDSECAASSPALPASADSDRRQVVIENLPGGVKLEMIPVPGGSFMMGSNLYSGSQPIHKVTLDPFLIGKYEVTQAQWKAVMGSNPSNFKGDGLPVENVSWHDVQEFCKKLSQRTVKVYRLPSEAEWEYAARAGSAGDYCFGKDEKLLGEYAWYKANSGNTTHQVGQKKPNAWGLFDVHGNVLEWCEDAWHGTYQGAPNDGLAWVSGGVLGHRMLRGGSWDSDPGSARAVYRDHANPLTQNNLLGFRVVIGGRRSSQKP